MSTLTARFITKQKARTNDALAREIKGKPFEQVLADHNRRDIQINRSIVMRKSVDDDVDLDIPIPSPFTAQPVTVKDWTKFVSHGAALFLGVLIAGAGFVVFFTWGLQQ
jgi:hypothetical protein